MARLTSRTTGVNTPINVNYKWSSYFNTGEWWSDQPTATTTDYSGIIWADVALNLTRTLPTSGDFQISAITIKSVNFTGLGTDYKLMAGSNEFQDKNVMLINSDNKVYLVREGTQLLMVKILKNGVGFSSPYTMIPPVTLSMSELKFVKISNNAEKVLNISLTDTRSLETDLKISKVGAAQQLTLALPMDPDGTDYIAPNQEVIFTDFA